MTDNEITADVTANEAEAPERAQAQGVSDSGVEVEEVKEALRDVVDPELGINVVESKHAVIDMTLTSAACPLTDVIEEQVATSLLDVVTGHTLNWVWMPPWGPDKITDDGREQLRALGFNV